MTLLKRGGNAARIGLIGPMIWLLLFAAPAKADSTRSVFQIIGSDIRKSGEKTLLFLSSPFRSAPGDWLWFGAGAAAQVGLISIDDKTTPWIDRNFDFIRLNRDPTIWKYWGERDYMIGATLATYGVGLIVDDEKTRRVARLCGESLLFSAMLNGATKLIAGRSRPEQGDKWKWNIWETDDANQSFPSGHTTIAFAISSVLAEEIDHLAVDIGVYTLASLTGISRIVDGRHWFADVVGGAAIGTLCGIFVTRNEDVSDSDQSISVIPHPGGLTLQYKL